MLKNYKGHGTYNYIEINSGDKVVIKYRDSIHYLKTGTVISVITGGYNSGDCSVSIDFSNTIITMYHTNLDKIIQLIEMETGDVLNILEKDSIELSIAGLIKYNPSKNFYFFKNDDRWQIEYYSI